MIMMIEQNPNSFGSDTKNNLEKTRIEYVKLQEALAKNIAADLNISVKKTENEFDHSLPPTSSFYPARISDPIPDLIKSCDPECSWP